VEAAATAGPNLNAPIGRKQLMNATAPAVSLSVAALSIDCADPAALADFWGKVLGRQVSQGPTSENVVVDASDPASGPRLFFIRSPIAQQQVP
jgi:hypothetical protein